MLKSFAEKSVGFDQNSAAIVAHDFDFLNIAVEQLEKMGVVVSRILLVSSLVPILSQKVPNIKGKLI
jgi:hypothetical protein